MEAQNGGLEDDVPFQLGDFLGRFHVNFQGRTYGHELEKKIKSANSCQSVNDLSPSSRRFQEIQILRPKKNTEILPLGSWGNQQF